MNNEVDIEQIDINEKIAVATSTQARVAARIFLEESCELAKMLPANKKILFVMHYSNGYPIEEIAELCGCQPRTVTEKLKIITEELNGMRKLIRGKENGKVNKSTKERIEAYFRREAERRRSVKGSGNKSESL